MTTRDHSRQRRELNMGITYHLIEKILFILKKDLPFLLKMPLDVVA